MPIVKVIVIMKPALFFVQTGYARKCTYPYTFGIILLQGSDMVVCKSVSLVEYGDTFHVHGVCNMNQSFSCSQPYALFMVGNHLVDFVRGKSIGCAQGIAFSCTKINGKDSHSQRTHQYIFATEP